MLSIDSIYIQIFANRFLVHNVDSGALREVSRNMEFASPRMLIADFTTAQVQLKEAVKSVRRGFRAPQILLHPMEIVDGGVTQVEYRVFIELGLGSGATKAAVHTGLPLSPDLVKQAIHAYKH